MMTYIDDLRIIVIGAGLFTLEHFFMLFNCRYMYITVQIMSMLLKQTSQWSPLAAFLVCIRVKKSQKTKTWIPFKRNLCSRSAPNILQTRLVFHLQPQTRAILKQKPSKDIYMQGCQVLDAVSTVNATSMLITSVDPLLLYHTAC